MTNKALYVLETDQQSGDISIGWRQEYNNYGSRKPGQLSAGSGTSPTLATIDGREVVVIGDNAKDSMNVLVFDYASGEKLLEILMPDSINGAEDSLIVTKDGGIIVIQPMDTLIPRAIPSRMFLIHLKAQWPGLTLIYLVMSLPQHAQDLNC